MKKYLLTLTFILTFTLSSLPQDNREVLQNLSRIFINFEYSEVIKAANQLLIDKSRFSNYDLAEIYRMKGIAHFSKGEDRSARYSFIEILKFDTSYALDPSTNSPKIISFFDDVKEEYLSGIRQVQEPLTIIKYDTVYIPINVIDTESEYTLKQALIRSIFLPGSGHLYKKSDLKSWLLTSFSAASIGMGIYYSIDTNKKEKLYLEEMDKNKIADKYSDYNFSYRMRNFAFISFAALWIYSQLDLLFFGDERNKDYTNILPAGLLLSNDAISINYLIRF
jgi:hypothetical protein